MLKDVLVCAIYTQIIAYVTWMLGITGKGPDFLEFLSMEFQLFMYIRPIK